MNLTYTNCTELVLWDRMRQAITQSKEVHFFQRAFYRLSVEFGKSIFLSKYILFFLQRYIAESLNV